MEILRVVFRYLNFVTFGEFIYDDSLNSLPETDGKETHPVYSQFDHAHTASKDCDELFPKCKSSLWNKNVILQ